MNVMGCNGGCNGNNKDEACDLNVRKLLGGKTPVRDPADYQPRATASTSGLPSLPEIPGGGGYPNVPGGGCSSTSTNGGGGFAISNCMFGPPTETVCQRQKRQLKYSNKVEFASAEADNTNPHFVTMNGLGFSPYPDEDSPTGDVDSPTRFMVEVPTHDLTACVFICEFRVRWTRPAVDPEDPDVVVYDGAAGEVQGRSSYLVTEDNVADKVSQPNGSIIGNKLLTTDGRCPCACIKLWHTWDIPGQVEFTIPGADGQTGTIGEDDKFTVTYEVTRVYVASKECEFPERCGEEKWLPLYAGDE